MVFISFESSFPRNVLSACSFNQLQRLLNRKCDYLHLSELKLTGQFRRNLTKISQYQPLIDKRDRKLTFENLITRTSYGINSSNVPKTLLCKISRVPFVCQLFDNFAWKPLQVVSKPYDFAAFSVQLPKLTIGQSS